MMMMLTTLATVIQCFIQQLYSAGFEDLDNDKKLRIRELYADINPEEDQQHLMSLENKQKRTSKNLHYSNQQKR